MLANHLSQSSIVFPCVQASSRSALRPIPFPFLHSLVYRSEESIAYRYSHLSMGLICVSCRCLFPLDFFLITLFFRPFLLTNVDPYLLGFQTFNLIISISRLIAYSLKSLVITRLIQQSGFFPYVRYS